MQPAVADPAAVPAASPPPPTVHLLHLDAQDNGQTLALALALRSAEYPFALLCRTGSTLHAQAAAHALPVRPLPETGLLSTRMIWGFMRALRDANRSAATQPPVCLVHACDPKASALATFCTRVKRSMRLVHTLRDPDLPRKAQELKKYVRRATIAVIAESNVGKGRALITGMDPASVQAIPPGIDLESSPLRKPRLDGRFVFAVTAELLPGKGHSLLFDALVELDRLCSDGALADMPPWELRILGQGSLFAALLQEAEAKGVERHLAFLGGQDTAAMLSACDALVVPTITGDSGSSLILQGWGAGLPVLASSRPAHLEILQPGRDSLIFAPTDHMALAHQMAQLARDLSMAEGLAREGSLAVRRFDAASLAAAHMAVYRSCGPSLIERGVLL